MKYELMKISQMVNIDGSKCYEESLHFPTFKKLITFLDSYTTFISSRGSDIFKNGKFLAHTTDIATAMGDENSLALHELVSYLTE